MLQFLCLQMCVYGGSAVPRGVVGDRLPWGGERQGAGGYWQVLTGSRLLIITFYFILLLSLSGILLDRDLRVARRGRLYKMLEQFLTFFWLKIQDVA